MITDLLIEQNKNVHPIIYSNDFFEYRFLGDKASKLKNFMGRRCFLINLINHRQDLFYSEIYMSQLFYYFATKCDTNCFELSVKLRDCLTFKDYLVQLCYNKRLPNVYPLTPVNRETVKALIQFCAIWGSYDFIKMMFQRTLNEPEKHKFIVECVIPCAINDRNFLELIVPQTLNGVKKIIDYLRYRLWDSEEIIKTSIDIAFIKKCFREVPKLKSIFKYKPKTNSLVSILVY